MSVRFDVRPLPPRVAIPDDALPRGSRGRLLCVTHVLPIPAHAGNAVRIHRLLRALADDGRDVLLVLAPAQAPTPRQLHDTAAIYPNLVVCQPDGTVWHRVTGGAGIEALHGRHVTGVPALLDEHECRVTDLERGFCPDPLVRLIWHLDRTWRPDVVLAEYVFLTRPFALLRPAALKVVDAIDVFSTKSAKVERHGVTDGLALGTAEEARLLRRADVLVGIQPDETAILCRLSPASVVVDAGVDLSVADRAGSVDEAPLPSGRRVLVVGSDNPMNLHGLAEFVRLAWPSVRAAVPDAELCVVGAIGDAIVAPVDGVQVLGHVDVLGPIYESCRVAINPAIAGTGLKIKTVEALAQLRPVVTWPAGADGLGAELRPLCKVASAWGEFAALVVDLLTDPTALEHVASARDAIAGTLSAAEVYGPLRQALDLATSAMPRPAPRTRLGGTGRLRVLTVLARHGTDRYPTALDELRGLFARQMPGVDHDVVVVDNALPPGRHPVDEVELLGAPNDAWEFSAWDEAIVHLGARLDEYDLVNLATSAFRESYVRHLDRFDEPMLRLVAGRAAVLGHIDHHLEPVVVCGLAAQSWVRSSFVFVRPAELRRLGRVTSVIDRQRFFTGDPRAPFREGAPVSPTYREYLRGWLTGDGTGHGVTWHSRFDLDEHTLRRFEDKALAIINEQLLSVRLRAAGCAPVDAIWLATRQAQGSPVVSIPPWPEQLLARDTDPASRVPHG